MPISSKTLYLNADRSKVVDEGSPDAAFLLVREGAYLEKTEAERYGVSGEEPQAYDAIADHEAKHGGETQVEADQKRAAMLEGQPDPDGEPVDGERADVKATDAAPQTKARTKAPENK